jgi:hypothetical protein
VDKQLKIEYSGGTLTNTELYSEEFELIERLCSDSQLRFGSCEAATLKFRMSNTDTSLKGEWLTVTDTLESEGAQLYEFGRYKVDTDNLTADRKHRDIVAYDAMYDIINAEVSAWYNTILPNADSTVTLKQFRTNFFTYMGITQEVVDLPNDSMTVTKTVEPTSLSGKTVITAICEINGCFGHIGRDGKFQYVFLKEMVDGLYPSDTLYPREDLFPVDPINVEQIKRRHYISATYEDYVTEKINKLQIRQEEDDIGCIYGTGNNCYVVQDNFLVYGKGADTLAGIAQNVFDIIKNISYRPFNAKAVGNLSIQIGDAIRFHTQKAVVESYVLERTLKGIQSFEDTYSADGEKECTEKVNSLNNQIIQLKGKTNILTRTVEMTQLTMADMEQNLQTQITATAEGLTTKVSKGSVISEINQSAEAVTITANKINLVGVASAIELDASRITTGTLSADRINTDQIAARFTKSTNMEVGTVTGVNMTALDLSFSELTHKDPLYPLSGTATSFRKEYVTINGTQYLLLVGHPI